SREDQRRMLLDSGVARALGLIHVWHPDVGFTASKVRNRGVMAAGSPYIVFLDGDCVPEVDFIARHKALAEPGCFVNGSRVMLSAELTQRVIAGAEDVCGRSGLYWLAQRLRGHASKLTHLLRLPTGWAARVCREFSWKGIRSCNMGVWKADYLRVDGFDESFVGWGHEDADLVLRLHHAGVARKNGFCATEVFHLWHREASRDNESQNARTVRERVGTDIVRSALGYSRQRANDDVVITILG
ncbi:MAG: galactosyltransferase-related protein, partial [Hylemonella sp.]|nr:galactosyltransferase-related protein [Hylemonella sp.]